MNAYLDLSYIFHLITLINIPYYFKRILNVKIRKIEVLSLMIFSLVLYFNVFIFMEYKYINLVFLLGYFFLVYHKRCIEYCLLYLFVYYANIATCMIFSTNIYLLNMMVFLNSPSSFFLVFSQLMNIIFIEIIMLSIKSIKLLKNYRVKVKIKMRKDFKEYSAYIDSGNTLLVDDLPVIFLKEIYFKDNIYKEMIVNGIGKKKCKYFKTDIIFNNMKRKVICASASNDGFKGCDCLINIHLLKEDNDEIIK
jgi:hypothetical protein